MGQERVGREGAAGGLADVLLVQFPGDPVGRPRLGVGGEDVLLLLNQGVLALLGICFRGAGEAEADVAVGLLGCQRRLATTGAKKQAGQRLEST
jgi:hypothetical protein